jgi:hypothetical protein
LSADVAKKFGEKSRSGNSVNVIVPVDEDVLFLFQRLQNPIDRFIHILKKLRIEQIGEFGIKEAVNIFKRAKSARSKDIGSHGMNAKFLDDSLMPLWIYFRVDPDGIFRT